MEGDQLVYDNFIHNNVTQSWTKYDSTGEHIVTADEVRNQYRTMGLINTGNGSLKLKLPPSGYTYDRNCTYDDIIATDDRYVLGIDNISSDGVSYDIETTDGEWIEIASSTASAIEPNDSRFYTSIGQKSYIFGKWGYRFPGGSNPSDEVDGSSIYFILNGSKVSGPRTLTGVRYLPGHAYNTLSIGEHTTEIAIYIDYYDTDLPEARFDGEVFFNRLYGIAYTRDDREFTFYVDSGGTISNWQAAQIVQSEPTKIVPPDSEHSYRFYAGYAAN